MADENKNKKSFLRRLDEPLDGEMLSDKTAKKLKHPDDPDVRILESKNQYICRDGWYSGEVAKNRSWYLYEPYARYKRTRNPDYKRYKKYSLAGTLAGVGMLVTGFASGNYSLAYTGAALALTSVGYFSGHSLRQWTTDERFEKVPWREERWIEQDKEPKDEGLYIRRTYKTHERYFGEPGSLSRLEWRALNEADPNHPLRYVGGTFFGYLFVGGMISFVGWACRFAPIIYAGAAPALYALGLYAGFLLGNMRARPEYQKVSWPEEKVQEKD